jgi:endoglucanase
MTDTVTVHEVCMARPDMICLVVYDADCGPQNLLGPLASARAEDWGDIVQADRETGGAGTDYAIVVGGHDFAKKYLHFLGEIPAARLNREEADDPDNYATIGGRTVTAVYRKTRPREQIRYKGAASSHLNVPRSVSMYHHIYLQLDDDLAQGGPYTIEIDGDTFPSTAFTFNDKTTRAIGLHVNQVGYRPGDPRKVAKFALWVPGYGTEGRTTLALDSAQLMDSGGGIHPDFTDIPIDLLHTATESIAGATNRNYTSTTVPPVFAESVTVGSPTSIEVTAHGFSPGQVLSFWGFGGTGSIESTLLGDFAITVTDANNFTVAANTTGDTYVAGTYADGFDSAIYTTFDANWFATNVYEIDFSDFVPDTVQGTYRVRIPGLGVSDPIAIDDAAYFRAGDIHARGYYNQFTGTALDESYGGLERGPAHVDGVNGFEVYASVLPACFCDETGAIWTTAPYRLPSKDCLTTYGSATQVAWEGPTLRDAGDWDWHTINHPRMTYWLCEFAYRHLPEASRDIDVGFPKSTTFCDPTLYAGTDSLGDQIHMAVAEIDAIRRLQPVGGGVYSGMQFNTVPGSSLAGHGGNDFEPSDISYMDAALMAPDPASSLTYVVAAAKLGQTFLEAGFTTLGNTWLDSAVLEWEWSEAIYQDYEANGSTGLVVGAWIADIATAASWDAGEIAAACAQLFDTATSYQDWRMWALATLYCATDDQDLYGDEVASYNSGNYTQSGRTGAALWEFCQTPSATEYTFGASQNMVAYYGARWDLNTTTLSQFFEQDDTSEMFWHLYGEGALDFTHPIILQLQEIFDVRSGVNNLGLCWTPGLGARCPQNALFKDREAMYVPGPDVLGQTIYYNFNRSFGISAFANLSIGSSTTNATVMIPDVVDADPGRLVEPRPYMTPIWECFFDHTYIIFCTEFTAQQSIVWQCIISFIMHSLDENTATEAPIKRVRRQVVVTT